MHEVCERMRNGSRQIDNGGKYLNALLDKYGQTAAGGDGEITPEGRAAQELARKAGRH